MSKNSDLQSDRDLPSCFGSVGSERESIESMMTHLRFRDHLRGVLSLALATGSLLCVATTAPAFEVLCGNEGGDAFGWAVASGGDYNGDGTTDFAIGAPCSWVGSSIRAGRVKVYSGKTGAVLLSLAGSDAEEKLGSALDWVPDLSGDGRAELVIGSATFSGPRPGGGFVLAGGKVELRSSQGNVLWTVFGATVNGSFGETVSAIPDVNGDGKADIAVGASGHGAAFLLSGANGAQIARNDGGELWGSLVGAAGDVNGDGTVDWFSTTRVATIPLPVPDTTTTTTVTTTSFDTTTTTSTTSTTLAPVPNRAGRLTVFSGKSPYEELKTFYGASPVDRLGRAAQSAGDVNDDNLGDLWVGSPGGEPSMLDDAGLISLLSATGEVILTISEPTPQQSAVFGTSLAVLGSLDGGTVNDVVAGAPFGRAPGRSQVGRVHAFAGEDGGWLWSRSGTLPFERLGMSMDSGFDYDGDGIQDVLVGAPGDAPVGKRGAGSVRILSGNDGEELKYFHGRRGRESRVFAAGPGLTREPVVRGFDSAGKRREVETRPFRGQSSTALSLAVLNGGRREETQNGFKTMLAVGTGRGGSKPEVAVYRAARRRKLVSRFSAGPESYTGGLNVAAGNFYVEAGHEIAVAPAEATANEVLVQMYWGAFENTLTDRIGWEWIREFKAFQAADKVSNQLVNASGANMASGNFTGTDNFDQLVIAPASGLPVIRVFGRTGTLLKEWLAFPFPGDGQQPNSGVALAVGDLDGQRKAEIVAAPAIGEPWVRAWSYDGTDLLQIVNFVVTDYGHLYSGGLVVATADVDLDGNPEIIVAPASGVRVRILAFEMDGSPVKGWRVYEPFGPIANKGFGLVGLDQFWRR